MKRGIICKIDCGDEFCNQCVGVYRNREGTIVCQVFGTMLSSVHDTYIRCDKCLLGEKLYKEMT